jgi:hypothetical protein
MTKNTDLIERVKQMERRATGKDAPLDVAELPAPIELQAINKLFAVKHLIDGNFELQKQLGIDYDKMTTSERYALFDLLFVKMMIDRPADTTNERATAEVLRRLSNDELQLSLDVLGPELAALDGIERRNSGLLPQRYINRDFFLCDMLDYAIKDDGVSMEAPIFTLSTKPDLTTWEWTSKDETRHIEVTPSVKGRATQHDKDILIFVISQLTEAINQNRQDAQNRTVRFVVSDYLIATNKSTGGDNYKRFGTALDRLDGTRIKTNIKTGGQRVREGFGLIDSYTIVEKSSTDERMIAVEITLSKWLFAAVQAHEVLTIHRNYFRLRKPLERRLYELARKHVGNQAIWAIGLELLREKCGAQSHVRAFKTSILAIAQADNLPEYRMMYDPEKAQVVFYTRDTKRLSDALVAGKRLPNR